MAIKTDGKLKSDPASFGNGPEQLELLGIWVGSRAQFNALDSSLKKTYSQWLATETGFWDFHIRNEIAAVTANGSIVGNVPVVTKVNIYPVAAVTANGSIMDNIPVVTKINMNQVIAVTADMSISGNVPVVAQV